MLFEFKNIKVQLNRTQNMNIFNNETVFNTLYSLIGNNQ